MVRTKQQRKRDRKRADPGTPPVPALTAVVSVTHGTSEVTIVFASQVNIAPTVLPTTWLYGSANRTITGIVSTDGTTYLFSLSGTAAASEPYAMQGLDPAARTPSGGYVAAKAGVLA